MNPHKFFDLKWKDVLSRLSSNQIELFTSYSAVKISVSADGEWSASSQDAELISTQDAEAINNVLSKVCPDSLPSIFYLAGLEKSKFISCRSDCLIIPEGCIEKPDLDSINGRIDTLEVKENKKLGEAGRQCFENLLRDTIRKSRHAKLNGTIRQWIVNCLNKSDFLGETGKQAFNQVLQEKSKPSTPSIENEADYRNDMQLRQSLRGARLNFWNRLVSIVEKDYALFVVKAVRDAVHDRPMFVFDAFAESGARFARTDEFKNQAYTRDAQKTQEVCELFRLKKGQKLEVNSLHYGILVRDTVDREIFEIPLTGFVWQKFLDIE